MRGFLLLLFMALPFQVQAFQAQVPDHYMLAVTLTPAFCDNTPKWRDSLQCRERRAFSVHGLWPQAGQGNSPSYCSGGDLQLEADQQKHLHGIMSDASQRDYQWKKHGRCSGLEAGPYFELLAREFLELKWPESLQPRGRDAVLERQAVLREFRRLNPAFPENGVVLRCEGRQRPPLLQEIRVCLTPEGAPRACASARSNCPAAVKVRSR